MYHRSNPQLLLPEMLLSMVVVPWKLSQRNVLNTHCHYTKLHNPN